MDVTDGAPFLDRALCSLATQTFADFEIVLLVHGANAATEAIITRWEQAEPRLRAIRSSKLTLSQAHNRVAREARAPLLARLDADDLALPHRLARQVAMFAADPGLGFAGGAIEIIDNDDRRLSVGRNPSGHDAIVAALVDSCPIVHSTLMVRAEIFWRAGAYRPGLNISEDYDLYCRLAETARGENTPEPLVAYRVHNRSMTSRRVLRMAIANEVVRTARSARAKGLGEPFVSGRPSLREASKVNGQTRAEQRLEVLATARRSRFSRQLLTDWWPLRSRGLVRNLALTIGLRPAYSAAFRLVQRVADWRNSRVAPIS